MTQSTDELIDRRSGEDRRLAGLETDADITDPIAAWPLTVPDDSITFRANDPWSQVVHRSIAASRDGDHADAGRAWDDAATWELSAHDPTVGQAAETPRHVGAGGIIAFHRELGRLTDWTFDQMLVSIESGRGPIVEAHLRTRATRGGRTLEIPTLLVFELLAMRVRKVTEFPGDVVAWDAFWRG